MMRVSLDTGLNREDVLTAAAASDDDDSVLDGKKLRCLQIRHDGARGTRGVGEVLVCNGGMG